jgi:triacylglycerol lipase
VRDRVPGGAGDVADDAPGDLPDDVPVGRSPGVRDGVRRHARGLLSPANLRGAAVEVAWLAAHAAIYPLGAAAERVRPERLRAHRDLLAMTPLQRGLLVGDVEAAGTPILLVHGLVDNRSVFAVLRRGLRRRGFGRVLGFNYSPLTTDVRVAAALLSAHIEALCAETGYERLHVIGHSMGGLVARYYVQRLGGDERVHTLVTLGSPHNGTLPARLLPHRLAGQLRPGSDVIRELAAPAASCRTRFLAVWSDLDQMMLPKTAARIEHPDLIARNLLVRGVGHMSLPINRRAVHEICLTLAHLGADGSTVMPGATSITADRAGAPDQPSRPSGVRRPASG